MMNHDNSEERAAFEAWFDGFRHGWKTERDVALAAWQARAALSSRPVQGVDVDALAQFIRSIDGRNSLGAGALAERIAEWLSSAPAQPVREPMTDEQIEALDFVGRGVISVRDMVRIVERHHGITKEPTHEQ